MDGENSQEICRAGQTMWARLMESQLWCLLHSVALSGEASEEEQWPLPAVLSWRKPSPSTHPDDKHFTSSPCDTGAFKLPQCWSSVEVSLSESVQAL